MKLNKDFRLIYPQNTNIQLSIACIDKIETHEYFLMKIEPVNENINYERLENIFLRSPIFSKCLQAYIRIISLCYLLFRFPSIFSSVFLWINFICPINIQRTTLAAVISLFLPFIHFILLQSVLLFSTASFIALPVFSFNIALLKSVNFLLLIPLLVHTFIYIPL